VDISDPAVPFVVSSLEGTSYVDVEVNGDYVFARSNNSINDIIDISDMNDPVVTHSFEEDGNESAIAIDNKYLYIGYVYNASALRIFLLE
jgi:hypothetical protein